MPKKIAQPMYRLANSLIKQIEPTIQRTMKKDFLMKPFPSEDVWEERSLSHLLAYLLVSLPIFFNVDIFMYYALCMHSSIASLFMTLWINIFVIGGESHLANYTCLISCIIITTAVLYISWRHVNYCSYSHLKKNKRLWFSYFKHPVASIFTFLGILYF